MENRPAPHAYPGAGLRCNPSQPMLDKALNTSSRRETRLAKVKGRLPASVQVMIMTLAAGSAVGCVGPT